MAIRRLHYHYLLPLNKHQQTPLFASGVLLKIERDIHLHK